MTDSTTVILACTVVTGELHVANPVPTKTQRASSECATLAFRGSRIEYRESDMKELVNIFNPQPGIVPANHRSDPLGMQHCGTFVITI